MLWINFHLLPFELPLRWCFRWELRFFEFLCECANPILFASGSNFFKCHMYL
jgi:hypothetical protein